MEVETIAENNESSVKNSQPTGAKKTADNAKKKTGGLIKFLWNIPAVRKFLLAHIWVILVIIIAIIVIILLIGLILFFTTLPGMIKGKINNFFRKAWGGIVYSTIGNTTGYVGSDQEIELAEYIQNMGYDIVGCGFADVEYDEDEQYESVNSKSSGSKTIKKIKANADGVDNLEVYLASDLNSYTLAKNTLVGSKTFPYFKTIYKLMNGKDLDSNITEKEFSSGLINYEGSNSDIKIDKEKRELIIETDKIKLAQGVGIDSPSFTYDLDTWSSRYGKPTELLLALHCSTMMPDLVNNICLLFNTKVDVSVEEINMSYDVVATKDGFSLKETDLRNYVLTNLADFIDTSGKSVRTNIINKYNTLSDTEQMKFIYKVIIGKKDFNQHGVGIDPNTLEIDSYSKDKFNVLAAFKADLSGTYSDTTWTDEELMRLLELSFRGKLGVKNVKWPYITAVRNHWYYEDINFNHNGEYVYRLANKATKTIDYLPEDGDVLKKDNITIRLDATFTNGNKGIVYQVCDPEANGPNDLIKAIFAGKYYKYDGTEQTAQNIQMSRVVEKDPDEEDYDFLGKDLKVDKDNVVEKSEVSFKENKPNALSAFAILENMHSEAGDHIYRDLKELVVKLEYFTEDEIKSTLKTIALWPLKTENKNRKWEEERDETTFTTNIVVQSDEKEVIAPSDGVIDKIEGDSVTIKFGTINDDTYDLYKFIYEKIDPYMEIDKDILNGMKVKLTRVTLDKSITEGAEVTRGQKLGTADERTLGINMYEIDDSKVDDIYIYFRQEHNNKYEEIMKNKKDVKYVDKTGYDVTSGKAGSSSDINLSNKELEQIFIDAAAEDSDHCVDPKILAAVAYEESTFNVTSDNGSHIGLFQYGKFGGTYHGLTREECFDAKTISRATVTFFHEVIKKYQAEHGALQAIGGFMLGEGNGMQKLSDYELARKTNISGNNPSIMATDWAWNYLHTNDLKSNGEFINYSAEEKEALITEANQAYQKYLDENKTN